MLLHSISTTSSDARYESTNLKFLSEQIHVAPVFVVLLGILPDEADLVLERLPRLVISQTSWCQPTMYTATVLGYAFEGHRVFDDLIIVHQLARWEVAERGVDLKAAVRILAVFQIGCEFNVITYSSSV